MTARRIPDDASGRVAAAAVLRAGGLIGLPTDTVYGIAVSLSTPAGIERLFAAKRRPPERGIVLLLADAEQATAIGEMDPAARALAATFWPGALTLVVRQRSATELPAVLTGGAPTIGLRVPDHPSPRAAAAAVGPLPTTSANRSGEPDARSAADVAAVLGDQLDLILDGGLSPGGRPSTVVDLSGELVRIAREGAIGRDRIRAVVEGAGRRLEEAPG